MKWISTLTNQDLESMKQIVKQAEEKNEQSAQFLNSKYEISYLKSVIITLENKVISDDIMDLEINN